MTIMTACCIIKPLFRVVSLSSTKCTVVRRPPSVGQRSCYSFLTQIDQLASRPSRPRSLCNNRLNVDISDEFNGQMQSFATKPLWWSGVVIARWSLDQCS